MSEQVIAKALAALKQDRFTEARDYIANYGLSGQLNLQHYLIRGLAELSLLAWADAAKTFTAAVTQYPDHPQLWSNLGQAEENLGDLKAAAKDYERSLELKPDEGDVHGNLSNVYRLLGRNADAEIMARAALDHGAPKAQALNSLGLALGRQGKFQAAEKCFIDALQLEPGNSSVLANLANLAIDQLNFTAAWPYYAKARSLNQSPMIDRDEGMARLLAGDYAIGWKLYQQRLKLPRALRLSPDCPLYAGEPLRGKKILLVAEQGMGDTIQFCRYGALLARAGAELIWAVQRPLVRLLAANVSGRVYGEDDQLPPTDYYLPLLSLPLMTEKFAPKLAPKTPYLRASRGAQLHLTSQAPKIGLVWSGSPTHERDHERSIDLRKLAPLWQNLKAQFYAPFIGAGLEQIGGFPIIRTDQLIGDFLDTAILLLQLDYLITVDTAIAHLAGALDVKTYLLLPYCPDWRWGIEGRSSPWYNSVTLLRQSRYGEWGMVVDSLASELC